MRAVYWVGLVCTWAMLSACSTAHEADGAAAPPASATTEPTAPPSGSNEPPPDPEPPPSSPPPAEPTPEPEPPTPPITAPQPEGTVAPDEEAIRAAEEAAQRDDLSFQTAETIDALSYGVVGDGKTDNTEAFRRLLAGGSRTIQVPAGDYVTHKLEFAANTVLLLEPGVIIRDAGRLERLDRLLNIRTDNVRIRAWGARVVANRQDYTSEEWRHGVYIFGAHNVVIEGLESSSHGGDGFYIGGPPEAPSTDVLLKGCKAANNRRQGLSITSARRVRVVDCELRDTNGTAPEFGVDLEPNQAIDVLDDIVFVRLRTIANHGGGVMVWLNALASDSEPVDVTVLDHASEQESPIIRVARPEGLEATVRYRAWN